MRALIVAHDHVSPAGPVADRLVERGYELVHHLVVPQERYGTPDVEAQFPSFASFDAVVVLGAPWSVYDETAVGSWVKPELEELRAADEAGVPVLGICFGGQLLAEAHGGAVQVAHRPEIGWYEVSSEDPVLAGLWFEWHFDRWTTPPGAELLAENATSPQAFRLRRNLAVQFHPELTSSSLRGWLDNGGVENAQGAGFDPEALVARTAELDEANQRRAHALVDSFLTL